jgi:NADH-quinone oxidoreductase subunit L
LNKTLTYHELQTVYFALATAALPLVAFVINFLIKGKAGKMAGWVSTVFIAASAATAILVFKDVWQNTPIQAHRVWFTIGGSTIYAGVILNNLSALMLLLVTLIALPVHIYSTAYMKGDDGYGRYFTYLSFFCFSMLSLVIVDSMVLLYGFWELVGFSSYLLIGFWFTRDKAVMANKKAFIMNRIGDVGLLVAILVLFAQYHTFDIVQLFGQNGLVSQSIISNGQWIFNKQGMPQMWQYIACAGIFMAVAAKSAQFPLHTWLPDAMEGPTSVSALIHAATMVAAGVFLLGRVFPMFNSTELDVLAFIGCFTAFMAATIALTQNDLKRILAYSTISQLGFMIMAMGINAYSSALFHLATHAFFKCLLFLCAGIVIHEMQHLRDKNKLDFDPQDVLLMGGLRKELPLTFIACLIGGIALVGLPLTSGYLSKDGILIQAFEWSDTRSGWYKIVPCMMMLSSWLTAFYVARLIFKVFFGDLRLFEQYPQIHTHFSDGKWTYRVPLIFLSLCCLFPVFSYSPLLYEDSWLFKGFLPAYFMERTNVYHTIIPAGLNILSLFVIYLAYAMYVQERNLKLSTTSALFKFSYNQWYIDKFYQQTFVKAVLKLGNFLYWVDSNVIDGLINFFKQIILVLAKLTAWIDKYIIDGILHLAAAIVAYIGNFARSFQNGKIQYYLFSMLAVIIAWFIIKTLI